MVREILFGSGITVQEADFGIHSLRKSKPYSSIISTSIFFAGIFLKLILFNDIKPHEKLIVLDVLKVTYQQFAFKTISFPVCLLRMYR